LPRGFPTHQSEQTRTAARPSRILTVFPFDYPKVKLQDLQSGYILFKEQKNAIKLPGNGQTKIKIYWNLKQDEQPTSIVIKASAKLRLGIYYLRKSVFLIFLNNHLTDY
jgi:hypothetical protein